MTQRSIFLSLFQLKSAAKQSKTVSVFHLSSPGREPKAGSSCLVAGWGRINNKGDLPDVLMSVNVTVVDRKKCFKNYSNPITKEMMCAGSDKADTCQVRCVQQVSDLS